MFAVYWGQDSTDAALLRQRLLEQGVSCSVRNELLRGAIGELPLSVKAEVFVYGTSDVDVARAIVAVSDATQET